MLEQLPVALVSLDVRAPFDAVDHCTLLSILSGMCWKVQRT